MKDKNGNVIDHKVIEHWKKYYERLGIRLDRRVFQSIKMPNYSLDGSLAILIPAGLDFEKIKSAFDQKNGYEVSHFWEGWRFDDNKRPDSDYLLIMRRMMTSPLQLDKDREKGINFNEGFIFMSDMVMQQKILDKPSVICCGSDHSYLAVNFANRIHPMISLNGNGLKVESVKKIHNHHQFINEELYERNGGIEIFNRSVSELRSTTPKVVGIYS